MYNINFESGLTNCEHILLEFETQPGQGVLYLDDIEMTGSLSRLEVIEPEPVPEKTKPEEGKSDDDKNPEFESLPKNNTGNLLKNGDFGDEDEYWKAAPDKKWSLRSGYAVMEIKNYDKERKNIGALRQYNMINNQNCTTFYVRGKYKTSADYTGEEFRPAVYCESNTGIAKWKRVPIEAATEWTEFHCTVHFKKDLPDNTLSFQLYVRQGTGKIYFDDLELYGIPD